MIKHIESERRKLIEIKQVSRWFDSPAGRFIALQNINLEICEGDYVLVVGKSGSGKSTLLNMLTGIDYPSEGSIIVDNETIHTKHENDLAIWRGKNIGIIFQFFQLVPTLTIRENILLAMDFVNIIPKSKRIARVNSLLRDVNIENHADKLPAGLSGGQQQRAAIARALANDPPIIVADEPTGNLDSVTAGAIEDIFLTLSGLGKTIIVVTHDRSLNKPYAKKVSLNDGIVDEFTCDREIAGS